MCIHAQKTEIKESHVRPFSTNLLSASTFIYYLAHNCTQWKIRLSSTKQVNAFRGKLTSDLCKIKYLQGCSSTPQLTHLYIRHVVAIGSSCPRRLCSTAVEFCHNMMHDGLSFVSHSDSQRQGTARIVRELRVNRRLRLVISA